MPASSSAAEEWDSSDKLGAIIQDDGLSGTDQGAYCREKALYPNNLPGGAKQLLPRPKAEQAGGTFCKWIRCTEHGGSKGIAA